MRTATTIRTLAIGGVLCVTLAAQARHGEPPWQAFFAAAAADGSRAREALEEIAAGWRDGHASLLVDLARLLPSARSELLRAARPSSEVDTSGELGTVYPRRDFPDRSPGAVGAAIRRRLIVFLERQTRQRFGDDLRAWRKWIWAQPYEPHPEYAAFKAELYARIDPAFRDFFPAGVRTSIRLDEIDWGGVGVNAIPPLRSPTTIPAREANWLGDRHLVFGVVINGEARAYPKRILAWHELATDRLGGVDLAIVYCTLCGTVIPYHSTVQGRRFTFGTSGLLYRSNKLMFDEETRSLWSSLDGTPAVGPLVGTGLQLTFSTAVTTTWGEWRREHPATTVLSLDTGFVRDYAEGAAYREYFATDRLMFEVPETDARLRNKAEVLALRPEVIGPGARPVAIAVDRLKREPIFSFDAGGRPFLVVTSAGGANRVYERGAFRFVARERDGRVRDADGRLWRATADSLVSESGQRLAGVPAHRAFWFGWRAQHPQTELYR